MDKAKVVNFIASQRKDNNVTVAELARKLKVSEKKIGDINYTYMEITDTQYMLFADTKTGAIQIYGMFVNLDDSMDIVKGISLK